MTSYSLKYENKYVRGVSFGIFSVFAVLCLGACIAKVVIYYNPVPVWDMFEGYHGFFNKIRNGEWRAWIVPHNEHRIFFQRILFWCDNKIFGGVSIFLTAMNLVLIGINASILICFQMRISKSTSYFRCFFIPFIIGWLYLLCQGENVTWAFQAQFHLAYMVPLIGFLMLARASQLPSYGFLLALIAIGICSIGTMGNGVIALPLFFIVAVFIPLPLYALSTLAGGILAQVVLMKFIQAGTGPDILKYLIANPVGFFRFLTRLIGSPFFYILGSTDKFFQVEIIGSLFLILMMRLLWVYVFIKRPLGAEIGLYVFCLYVVISYTGAAVGRFAFGLDNALVLHYTTPALLGWAALAILFSRTLEAQWQHLPRRIGFIAFAALVLHYQLTSIGAITSPLYELRVNALGLALGVDDQNGQRTMTSPDFFRQVKQFGEPGYLHRDGIFQSYPYNGIREQLGQPFKLIGEETPKTCAFGRVNRLSITDGRFARFATTLDVPEGEARFPELLRLVNADGKQVGFGLVKSWWTDRQEASRAAGAYHLRVEGYVMTTAQGDLRAYVEDQQSTYCTGSVQIQPGDFEIVAVAGSPQESLLPDGNVLNKAEVPGSDPYSPKGCFNGFRVYGSFGPKGDADVGKVVVRVGKDDILLYRSGPTGGRQILEAGDGTTVTLPVETEWVGLKLPERILKGRSEAEVQLVDQGAGWGEWLAIAVRSDSQCKK